MDYDSFTILTKFLSVQEIYAFGNTCRDYQHLVKIYFSKFIEKDYILNKLFQFEKDVDLKKLGEFLSFIVSCYSIFVDSKASPILSDVSHMERYISGHDTDQLMKRITLSKSIFQNS